MSPSHLLFAKSHSERSVLIKARYSQFGWANFSFAAQRASWAVNSVHHFRIFYFCSIRSIFCLLFPAILWKSVTCLMSKKFWMGSIGSLGKRNSCKCISHNGIRSVRGKLPVTKTWALLSQNRKKTFPVLFLMLNDRFVFRPSTWFSILSCIGGLSDTCIEPTLTSECHKLSEGAGWCASHPVLTKTKNLSKSHILPAVHMTMTTIRLLPAPGSFS